MADCSNSRTCLREPRCFARAVLSRLPGTLPLCGPERIRTGPTSRGSMPIRRDDIVSIFLSRRGTLLHRGKLGIDRYRSWVAECSQADDDFPVKLREVALEALNDEKPELV